MIIKFIINTDIVYIYKEDGDLPEKALGGQDTYIYNILPSDVYIDTTPQSVRICTQNTKNILDKKGIIKSMRENIYDIKHFQVIINDIKYDINNSRYSVVLGNDKITEILELFLEVS